MTAPIPSFLQQHLARELARGERVVWLAQPEPLDRALTSVREFLVGIVMFPFAVFWMLGATGRVPGTTTDVASPFAYFVGSIFLLGGAWELLTPLRAWWVARRTLYAVTERRAILIEVALRRVSVQSFSGDSLIGVIRHEDSSGFGDVIFEREASHTPKGRTVYRDVGFRGIKNVRSVQDLLPTPSAIRTR